MASDYRDRYCEVLGRAITGRGSSLLQQIRQLLSHPGIESTTRWDELPDFGMPEFQSFLRDLAAVEGHPFLKCTAQELFTPMHLSLSTLNLDTDISTDGMRLQNAVDAWLDHLETFDLHIGGDWMQRRVDVCSGKLFPEVGESDLDEDWYIGDKDPFCYSLRRFCDSRPRHLLNDRPEVRDVLSIRIEGTEVSPAAFKQAFESWAPLIRSCSDLVLSGFRPDATPEDLELGRTQALCGSLSQDEVGGNHAHNEVLLYFEIMALLHTMAWVRPSSEALYKRISESERPWRHTMRAMPFKLARRLGHAARLSAEASHFEGRGRLALAFASLESILGDRSGRVTECLRDRFCALLVPPKSRVTADRWFKKMYDRRCEIVHGRESDAAGDARTFRDISSLTGAALIAACECVRGYYRMHGTQLPRDEFFRICDESFQGGEMVPFVPPSLISDFDSFLHKRRDAAL
ncbi:MAG TPA: hypothetical protein VFF69_16115 [Phycisphaerales bacterium]|nr:hypothetical protein [Phycisphaerales bacterium]